jgi:muconate cycloisomerase
MATIELTTERLELPLVHEFTIARGSENVARTVAVRLRWNGRAGLGESAPIERYAESIDSVMAALAAHRLHDAPYALDAQLAGLPPAARCGLDIALHDLIGKDLDRPLYRLLGLEREATPRTSFTLGIAPLTQTLAKVRAVGTHPILKIKLGRGSEIETIAAVRDAYAGTIRIDANEAWTADNVRERILELKPFNITCVEQPVPHEQIAVLAAVRREVGVPIMLDESLCSMIDAEHAEENDTCDLFNLRLSKCGGFIRTLRLAQHAKRHKLGYQLGCQIGETAILSAAGRHFASSVKDLRYVEGSYDNHLVREALATTDLTFGWGGWAPALDGPGLGITIDPAALQRVAKRTEVLLG